MVTTSMTRLLNSSQIICFSITRNDEQKFRKFLPNLLNKKLINFPEIILCWQIQEGHQGSVTPGPISLFHVVSGKIGQMIG